MVSVSPFGSGRRCDWASRWMDIPEAAPRPGARAAISRAAPHAISIHRSMVRHPAAGSTEHLFTFELTMYTPLHLRRKQRLEPLQGDQAPAGAGGRAPLCRRLWRSEGLGPALLASQIFRQFDSLSSRNSLGISTTPRNLHADTVTRKHFLPRDFKWLVAARLRRSRLSPATERLRHPLGGCPRGRGLMERPFRDQARHSHRAARHHPIRSPNSDRHIARHSRSGPASDLFRRSYPSRSMTVASRSMVRRRRQCLQPLRAIKNPVCPVITIPASPISSSA